MEQTIVFALGTLFGLVLCLAATSRRAEAEGASGNYRLTHGRRGDLPSDNKPDRQPPPTPPQGGSGTAPPQGRLILPTAPSAAAPPPSRRSHRTMWDPPVGGG